MKQRLSGIEFSTPQNLKYFTEKSLNQFIHNVSQIPEMKVRCYGRSRLGRPLHHLKFGQGPIKALLIGYPHPNEPMGGLTVQTLVRMFSREPGFWDRKSGVEWHLIPCADPDGLSFNEGWSRHPFDMKRYLSNVYRQASSEQVEWSFPMNYKNYEFKKPIPETRALLKLIERIKPDFHFSLHNSLSGGAYFYVSQKPGPQEVGQISRLLKKHDLPLHLGEPELPIIKAWQPAFYKEVCAHEFYEQALKYAETPQLQMQGGLASWEISRKLNPKVLSLVCEVPFLKHPHITSQKITSRAKRTEALKSLAQTKGLEKQILDLWLDVRDSIPTRAPLYKVVRSKMREIQNTLVNGWSETLEGTHFDGFAKESELIDLRFTVGQTLARVSELGRLIDTAPLSAVIKRARRDYERVWSETFSELSASLDLRKFQATPLAVQARVQLQTGFIFLDTLR